MPDNAHYVRLRFGSPPQSAGNVLRQQAVYARTMSRSALIVSVPAPALVNELRAQLATDASHGVPPHITLLFPFMPAQELSADVLTRVQRIASARPSLPYALSELGWFGSHVLWIAPSDPEPFLELIAALTAEFPAFLPYGGAFDSVLPHLTIGESVSLHALREAELAVTKILPIHGVARVITLLQEDTDGHWHSTHTFPFSRE